MKKIFVSLIACLAFIQSASLFGATSALTESLLEYEAITSAIGTNPQFEGIIGSNEFITDIVRKTDKLDVTGKVKYLLTTCTINRKDLCRQTFMYIVKLDVEPNPAIGPNIVTVVEIKKID